MVPTSGGGYGLDICRGNGGQTPQEVEDAAVGIHGQGELRKRCVVLDEALGARQKGHINDVAGGMRFGLIAHLVLLMLWPGTNLPLRSVIGFQMLGVLEDSGIWRKFDVTTAPLDMEAACRRE